MEVHHHTHTPRKKFRHYFWEFFMLFLAVTAGFFVENQREHYIEHRREKQFMASMANDLRNDTSRLSFNIAARNERQKSLDTLISLMNLDNREIYANDIYFHAITAARTLRIRFLPNDGTMLQLKNSGAFRLVRNRKIVDSLANYDVNVRNFMRQGEVEEIIIHEYRLEAAKIFNALEYYKIIDADGTVFRPTVNLVLPKFDASLLKGWNYKTYMMYGINTANRRDARNLLRQATTLLKLLKEEYDLK
jgi:hypothetical protein